LAQLVKKFLLFIEDKGHYHVHKSPPVDPILRQLNSFHTFIPHFFKIPNVISFSIAQVVPNNLSKSEALWYQMFLTFTGLILQISLHHKPAQWVIPHTMRVKTGMKMHALAVSALLARSCAHRKYVLFPAQIRLRSLESAALCVQVGTCVQSAVNHWTYALYSDTTKPIYLCALKIVKWC